MNKYSLERLQDLAGLNEMAVQASNTEYIDAVRNFYKNDSLVSLIQQGERMAMGMSSGGIENIQKSDYGNVIVKWIENQSAIFLLGIISKTGRLKKDDIKDINIWLSDLADKIKDGKELYTSPNKVSEKLLDKVVSKLESQGIPIIKKESPSVSIGDDPNLQWKNIVIKRRP